MVAWMKSWGQEEVLVAWMKSWGVGGSDGGMDEGLQGGRRCWWHGRGAGIGRRCWLNG